MQKRTTSILIVIIASLTSLFFAYQLQNLRFDYDIEKFFPLGHPETEFYESFRQEFENDSDYIFIGLKNKKGIFQKDFLLQVDSLCTLLKELPSIDFVESPTSAREYKRAKLSARLLESPFLHFKNPNRYERDSARIYNHPYFKDFLVSKDAKSIQLYVKHQPILTENDCDEIVDQIMPIINGFDFDEKHIAGKCYGQTSYSRMIKQEVLLFVTASTFIVALFLWFSYFKIWGVWMPLTIVGLTVLWTMGFLVYLDKPIYLITNTVPTILLVIGVSDCIHLLTNYLDRDKINGKVAALKASIKEVGFATILTTLTTGIGFLTMTSSNFTQLFDLGIFATIGLVIAFGLTYTLLPALVYLHPPLKIDSKRKYHSFLSKKIEALYQFVLKNPYKIIITALIICLLSIAGAFQIKTDNFMLDDLKESHPMIQDFSFFENNFSGTRPLDMLIELRDTSQTIFDLEVLNEIEKVGAFLEKEYEAKGIITPATIIKHANMISHFGKTGYFKLPKNAIVTEQLSKRIDQFAEKLKVDKLIGKQEKRGRIIGKLPDWGSHLILQKNKAFNSFLEQEIPNRLLNYKMTGTMHLVDINNQLLVSNILWGLLIAVCMIGLLIAILFKSIRLVLITIVSNLLPLIIVAGLMGVLGIDLKISTSIIFIISFGVAVDDSIHFLSKFKKKVNIHSVDKAIQITFQTTGKAIIITSVILISGFLTLCISDFLGIFYIGIFVAFTLFVALIVDLTLLPVLLMKYYKTDSKDNS